MVSGAEHLGHHPLPPECISKELDCGPSNGTLQVKPMLAASHIELPANVPVNVADDGPSILNRVSGS